MSDEKNVGSSEPANESAQSAAQSEAVTGHDKPAGDLPQAVSAIPVVSAAVSKAEQKAAKTKAKADAKLSKVLDKEARAQAKAEAKLASATKPEVKAPEAKEPAAKDPEPKNLVPAETEPAETEPKLPEVNEPEAKQEQKAEATAVVAQPAPEPEAKPVEAAVVPPAQAKPEPKAQPAEEKPVVAAQDPAPDAKAVGRKKKLEKVRATAAKESDHAPARKKTGAVLLSLVAVLASAGVVTTVSLLAPTATTSALPAAVTSLPAGDATNVCAATPALLKGVEGTDPQFEPGAKQVSSNLRSTVVSDLAKRIPGSSLSAVGSSANRSLSDRLDDAEAAEAKSANDEGLTGRVAKVSTLNNADEQQVFSVQPLGEIPSIGSTLRIYQAKDGDLAGLAAASCLSPASTWRFAGLQTSTGSTAVLHLSNPTSTTAQVAIDLRGPEGLIDTSTLQNIVIAPGESRAIVLGGYAQNLGSVGATVTSTGGKVSAYVQQAALRGLIPSGIDLVAPNSSVSNTQVIPGVWIEDKENLSKLTKDNKSLVPQLHVVASGSQGAGYTVTVLGSDGEVAASFEKNLAVSSNATASLDLSQLAGGYYTIVVKADAPVSAAVRMVRGSDPKDPSDTAWAVGSTALTGNQVMSLSANGTGKFVLAATDADSLVEAVVVNKDGSLEKAQKINVKAKQSRVFDPRETSEDAQAVIFSADAKAYVAQLVLGSDQSIAWASMPQANAGRDGIAVNVGG